MTRQATPETTPVRAGVNPAAFTSRRTLVARRFIRNKPAVAALILLALGFIGCYALPSLLPYGYTDLDINALLQPPSDKHWFGTNALGQDLLARTLSGMQKSMLIGFCVALISTTIAATVGSVAGYFGGLRDRALMWLVDLLLVVPSFLLIAIVTPRTKQSNSILWLIVLLAAFGWMVSSRMVRGLTMSLREREFVRAAKYMGVSSRRIIVHHIVPNVASILIIDATLNVGIRHPRRNRFELLGIWCPATRRVAGHADRGRHSFGHHLPVGLSVPGWGADTDRVVRQPRRRRPAGRAGPRQSAITPQEATKVTALLEVTDLNVTFETGDVFVPAVRGTTYHIDPGEVVAIVGESGSGKSTAAMAVVGLLPEYADVSGSVRLHGQELLGLSDQAMSRIRGRAIGTVFQDPMSALTPVYTIGDQIAEAIEVHNRDIRRADTRKRAVELLELVGIAQPDRRAKAFPHELSGGERQRVVIAIAIANDPDLLICDEPTTALDVTVQAQILDVLRTARDVTGAGVLIITHDLGVVSEFADRAMVMYAGRGVEIATVEDLYRDRRMPYTVGLLGSVPRLDAPQGTRLIPIPGAPPTMSSQSPDACPFAPRCPLVIDECRSAEPDLVTIRDGHWAACIRTDDVAGRSAAEIFGVSTQPAAIESAAAEPPLVLQVTDLSKTYPLTKGVVLRRQVGEVRAVDGVSFTLEQGRTLGIVGESGSGKSTTLSQILELARPQAGSIEILGADVATLDAAARRKLRTELQVVFQDPVASLDPRFPVFDVIAEPLVANGFDRPRCEERVAELLAIVGLDHADASRYPAAFSGGQKQRIGIARALALQPKILALDEPVSALDVSIQAGIINLLLDLQAQFGLSYLFVSHDLSVVKHLAHRVAVMYRGAIVEQGDGDQVFTNPQHEYTQRLLAAVPRAHPDVAGG